VNDLDLCLEAMLTVALHSPLDIAETVRDEDRVIKGSHDR